MNVRLANAIGVSKWRLERVEVLSRVASIVLTAVLVLSTACVIGAAFFLHAATGRIRDVRMVANDLRTASYALATEQSLARLYRLEPTADTFIANRAAAASLEASMRAVRTLCDATGRDVVDRVLVEHRQYLDRTRRLLIAVNRGDQATVVALQRDRVDPIFGSIASSLDAEARRQDAIAKRGVDDVQSVEYSVANGAVVFSLVGLACLWCFLAILRTYRSRLLASYGTEMRRLEEAALVDALTGVGNHRAYTQRLADEIARADHTHQPLTLALLDVDEFKVVNDRDGHVQGDRVLSTLGRLLTSLRVDDRAYRIGGDEFAIVFPGTSIEGARSVMDRLQTQVADELFGATLSIGLAGANGAATMHTLVARADEALYGAKRAGRNRVFIDAPGDASRSRPLPVSATTPSCASVTLTDPPIGAATSVRTMIRTT